MVFDTCTRDKPDELLLLTVVAAEALATLLLDTTIPRLPPEELRFLGSGRRPRPLLPGPSRAERESVAATDPGPEPGDGGVQKQRG